MYLTILMPCLNEENTLEECILNAQRFLNDFNINGEILVVDNGSVDNSINIARKNGARVVIEKNKGYGNALRRGIKESHGEYLIFADCDMSYDFYHLEEFVKKFNEGFDYVNGNRFKGGIKKGAMPFSHKLGVPFLSIIANLKYKTPIHDYHCGLRGMRTSIAKNLNFNSSGMEFATEIIMKFKNYKITEIPIILYKDKRNKPSHLNTIRDGFRHLKFIFKN